MPIKHAEVEGITGLLDAVVSVIRDMPENSFLWYRGLSNKQYQLLPGIMRFGKSPAEVFEREKRLLTRFRQRSLPFWPSGYPQSDWEHLFAMQHFGFPTRLLDWSENLFIAAYFALRDGDKPDEADCRPLVWCLDPVEWNRATPLLREYGNAIHVLTTVDGDLEAYRPETNIRRSRSPVAMFGTLNSGRMVSQRGTFMVWGEDARPAEEYATDLDVTLWCFEITGNRKALARELNLLGFGETMIIPELGSLATELTRMEGWR